MKSNCVVQARRGLAFRYAGLLILLTTVMLSPTNLGCAISRCDHRQQADCEANTLIHEKSDGLPWQPRAQYSGISGCPLPGGINLGRPIVHRFLMLRTALFYQLPIADDGGTAEADESGTETEQQDETDEPVVAAIPDTAWQDIPEACRDRMFDFESLRLEADRTNEQFDSQIANDADDSTPRLDLREIIDLALLNSRDYQTQKETLYRRALELSLERYDYLLFPVPNNGTNGEFSHSRPNPGGAAGTSQSNLSFAGTSIGWQKLLVTGGDILASFANNILLTFNGPDGFAKEVSSDLLFEFTQPLLQIDVRFESLTQAERNLVYAARNFARFRNSSLQILPETTTV